MAPQDCTVRMYPNGDGTYRSYASAVTANLTGMSITSGLGTVTGTGGGSAAVTLTGSGFGTKTNPSPTFFNTFDSITTGTAATNAAIGLECFGDPAYIPSVTTNRFHSGSKSMFLIYPTGKDAAFPETGITMPAGTTTLYYGNWVYWEWTTRTTQSTFVFKWSRGGSNNNGGPYHGYPAYHNTQRPGSDGKNGPGLSGDTGYRPTNGVDVYDTQVNKGADRDGWHWVEYKYKLSSPAGTNNGKFQYLVDGVVNANLVNQVTRATGDTSTFDWFISVFDGNDQYGTGNEYRLYVDEMVVDNTFARVIATDNSTYGSSTKWAPQAPSSWSDTSIIIPTPNYSDFTSSSTIWFHVFDANDNHVTAISKVVP